MIILLIKSMLTSLNNKMHLNRCKIITTSFRIYHAASKIQNTKPRLRRKVLGLSSRRPDFKPRPTNVGFMVENWYRNRIDTEHFDFPCAYHPSIPQYSYLIHLSSTLHWLSNWQRRQIKHLFSFSLCVDYKDTLMHITAYCGNNTKQRKTHVHCVSITHSLLMLR